MSKLKELRESVERSRRLIPFDPTERETREICADRVEAAAELGAALTSPRPLTREVLEEWGFQWDDVGDFWDIDFGRASLTCRHDFTGWMIHDGNEGCEYANPQPRTEGHLASLLLRLEDEGNG